MDDDINVQNGIATVYELVKYANVYAQQDNVSLGAIQAIKKELVELMSIFGVKLEASDNQINDEKIKQLIEERNIARKNKDFARSDEIRDNHSQGVGHKLIAQAKENSTMLTLNVYQKNERAVAFYQHEDFKIIKTEFDKTVKEKEYLMRWTSNEAVDFK